MDMTLVPAQGFEPWTIGLKDRRSNQAELRRLKMIFPFSVGSHQRSAWAIDRGKEGAGLVGSPLPFLGNLRPLRRPNNVAKPELGPASCFTRSWRK